MNDVRRDPVCGMIVLPDKGVSASYEAQTISFCSEYCKTKFQEHPKRSLACILHERSIDDHRDRPEVICGLVSQTQ